MTRLNGITLATLASVLVLAAPAHGLGPSNAETVVMSETHSYGAAFAYEPADAPSAFNSARGEYLAVWLGQDSGPDGVILARRVRADGSPADAVIQVGGEPTSVTGAPAVAYDSDHDEYLVVWTQAFDRGANGLSIEVFGRRLAGDGAPVAGTFRISTSPRSWGEHPAVAYDAERDRYLVAWSAALESGPDSHWEPSAIHARTVVPGGAMGVQHRISLDATDGSNVMADHPALAVDPDGDSFAVGWSESRPRAGGGGLDTHHYARVVDPSGAPRDSSPDTRISEGEGLEGSIQRPLGMAYSPVSHEFLAVFEQRRSGELDVVAQRVGAHGAKLGGNRILGSGGKPAMAYGGGQYLVAWASGRGLVGTLLDNTAEPVSGQTEALLSASACFANASLAYGNGEWLLTWHAGGRAISEDRSLLDLRAVTITSSGGRQPTGNCGSGEPSSPPPGKQPIASDPPAAGPGPGPAGTQPADATVPRILSSAIRKPGGRSKLFLRLSEPARVTLTIERLRIGRRSAGTCRATTRGNRRRPRCLIARRVALLNATAGTTERAITLPKLAAGAHRVRVVAIDAAGNASRPSLLRFGSNGR
jgi:hypothetical protein